MRVFVQIVDTKTGKYEHIMIDEPIAKGYEISNAISHLVGKVIVEWSSNIINENLINTPRLLTGVITNTNKVINVVCYEEALIPSYRKNCII